MGRASAGSSGPAAGSKKAKAKRSRAGKGKQSPSGVIRYVGTLNNPGPGADAFFEKFAKEHCAFWAGAHEVGESGTPHVQFFFDLLRRRTIKSLVAEFGTQLGHLAVRQGSIQSNADYCSKDGELVVHGVLPKANGHRSDLDVLHADAKSPEFSVLELADRHGGQFYRNYRCVQLVRGLARAEQCREFRTVDVYVFWGDPGAGKTREALKRAPGAFVFPPVSAGGVQWADGLADHKEVVIDDFEWSIPFVQILRILDGHRLQLPIKGGFVVAQYTKVFITSNFHPSEWYPQVTKNRGALMRRLKVIKKFSSGQGMQAPRAPVELGSDEELDEEV